MTDRPDATAAPGIGRLNERSLHAALKAWCSRPGDSLECVVDGYVVDVVRDDLLIEVQTSGIAGIRTKLLALAENHHVQLVYPLLASKVIKTISKEDGSIVRERRSPLRQTWANLFDELVYWPEVLEHPHLDLLAVRVAVSEIRCDDGQGSWRRRGVSILDTALDEVLESRLFRSSSDLGELLPDDLQGPVTHRELGRALGVKEATAMRASYCLRKLGQLREVGKQGRAMLVERVP